MADRFLLYGATGYTGRLIAQRAREWNLEPLLAGRTEAKVKAVAEKTGSDYRIFALNETKKMESALQVVDVVVNAAGPFSATAVPIVNACLRTQTHYLDITGEINIFESLARRHEEAKSRSIMIMPGAGFDVVPSDCLAAHVAGRMPQAHKIILAIAPSRHFSRGTLKTAVEGLHLGSCIRENGDIKVVKPRVAKFEFDEGPRSGLTVPLGDVSTAFHSTGVENIEVYIQVPALAKYLVTIGNTMRWLTKTNILQFAMKSIVDILPEGPSAEARENDRASLLGIAKDAQGNQVSSWLKTPEIYKLTVLTTLAITRKVLSGNFKPGFQTPSLAYGADLILEIEGTKRKDLQ